MEIKKGDYIEGYEEVGGGEFKHVHKMRVIVDSINNWNGETIYYGQADDAYGGARGGTISKNLGEIRVITDEKPFTNKWWLKEQKPEKANLVIASNRAIIMTEDRKCVLRGTSRTKYELCLVNEKSRRTIKEFRGLKTAESFTEYGRIRLTDKVKEYYNTKNNLYTDEVKDKIKLVPVKVKKLLLE